MNRQRLNELANLIERTQHWDGDFPDEGSKDLLLFNMQSFREPLYTATGNHCGSTVCLAGLAVIKYDYKEWEKRSYPVYTAATELLDLTRAQAEELFTPDTQTPYSEITPQVAAEVLRKMAASEDNEALPEWPYPTE